MALPHQAENKPMHSDSQTFADIVSRRRSLRAFLPQPVERKTLEAIFSSAGHSPSNCNTQPWLVHVVCGAKLESLRQKMPAAFMAGELSLDFPYDGSYDGVYKERQYGSAQALYDSVGITRAEKALRQETFMRNFTFFGAPHAAFLFMPQDFGLREAADLGMYAQTLMLGMTAHGLGSCPQTSVSFLADLVREELSIEACDKLVFGISFGYPDPEAAINNCKTDRAALTDVVTFHS